jgi:hypothetical protein
VLYLAPMPVAPLEAAVDQIYEAIPDLRDGWPYPTFHMTVALRGGWDGLHESFQEFTSLWGHRLPLTFQAREIGLWLHREGAHSLHSTHCLGSGREAV